MLYEYLCCFYKDEKDDEITMDDIIKACTLNLDKTSNELII